MASSMASMTTSLSIDFSRATASAICRSSSRLAEMPVRLMGFFPLLGRLVFGCEAGGGAAGPPLHVFVVQPQLGRDDPGEGDHGRGPPPLRVDSHLVAFDPGQHA